MIQPSTLGDPTYLELLRTLPKPGDITWIDLHNAWEDVKRHCAHRDVFLVELAARCMRLIEIEIGQSWEDLLETASLLHIKKNRGYSGTGADRWANFRVCEEFPGISALNGVYVRMGDKYIRIKNLLADPTNEQVSESLYDTLFDLGAYALIAVCLLIERGDARGLDRG